MTHVYLEPMKVKNESGMFGGDGISGGRRN